jgi:hypothetical protein
MAAVLALLWGCLGPLAAPPVSAASAPAPAAPAEAPKLTASTESAQPHWAKGQPQHKNPKADWQVAAVVDSVGSNGAAAALVVARGNGMAVSGGGVRVIVEATDVSLAQASVAASGAAIEAKAGNLIQVLATPAELAALLDAPGIGYVRAPMPHVADAVVAGEGVGSTNASGLQLVGQTGAGVKVAVIDLGFEGLAAAQGNGDLPVSVTSVDDCSGGFNTVTEHGTAVAEIVHEMAPGADLYLICVDTEVQLANAEAYAKANGIQIVNHSVSWFNSARGDGTGGAGTPDATVADANANGILWVNAAGNHAQTHWSGKFVNDGYDNNLFATGDMGNTFYLPSGLTVCAHLKWDNWPVSAQDYDLEIYRSSDYENVAWSENEQSGSQPPVEDTCFTNSGASENYFIAIYRYDATAAPRFDLFVDGPNLQYQTAAGSVTEPASSPSAFAVGAVCWQGTTIEPFSSRGPTIDNRIKPDLSGPDQVSSFTYGAFSSCSPATGFPGTSAAAPHVVGAAALVKAAHPTYTVAQLKSYLQTNARDLGAAGKDNLYGSGLLFLPSPPGPPTGVTAAALSHSALVSWTAPTSNGGKTITGYAVTSSPDDKTCTTTGALSCTVSGLTNGQAYTFTVTATNSVGTGVPSTASDPVTPVGVPDKPTGVTATAGAGSALVSWTAPVDTGGSAITGYTATSSPGGKTCATSGTSCTVSGLTNGQAYTFTVTATNGLGTGAASTASAPVTPTDVPDKPTSVHAVARDSAANVLWVAPYNNGSAITDYTVTSSPEDKTCTTSATSCTVTGLTNGQPYTFTVIATNGVGPGPASDPSVAVTPHLGANYFTVTPVRVLDSRPGVGHIGAATFHARVKQTFAVATVASGVPTDAIAVTGNVTVVGQTRGGFVTVAPSLTSGVMPLTSTINFPLGDTRANGITVPLHAGGTLDAMYWSNSADTVNLLFDVTGYFRVDALGANYFTVTPVRVLDSRPGAGHIGAALFHGRVKQTFAVATVASGVPTDAIAVTGNVTVVGQTRGGFVTLAPSLTDGVMPLTSTINFPLADTRANGVTVPLAAGGTLDAMYWSNSADTVNLLFDVTGYFRVDASGATYFTVTPARVLDSRPGAGHIGAATFHARVKQAFAVATVASGVPTDAIAVTGNVTVVGQTRGGFVTVAPSLTSGVIPLTSTINFPLGDTRANGVTVALHSGGTLDAMYWSNSTDTVNLLFDVTGYFVN